MGFQTVKSILEFNHDTAFEDEVADRRALVSRLLFTGVKPIDHVFEGIMPNDFVLLGAKTGSGKTEMLTQIASNVAKQGKYVDMFALEASKFEIHRRIKFKICAEILKIYEKVEHVSFSKWIRFGYDKQLEKHEKQIQSELDDMKKYLRIHYRPGSFDLADFLKLYNYYAKDSHVMLFDHAQFFDLDDSKNENQHVKDMTLKMYDMVNAIRVPIILVSHLRKTDSGKRIPGIEDFYGSSELGKKVTRALILVRYKFLPEINSWETIFNFEKNRELSPTALKTVFNLDVKRYADKFEEGQIIRDNFYTIDEIKAMP